MMRRRRMNFGGLHFDCFPVDDCDVNISLAAFESLLPVSDKLLNFPNSMDHDNSGNFYVFSMNQ
jgi:hypothetical protein